MKNDSSLVSDQLLVRAGLAGRACLALRAGLACRAPRAGLACRAGRLGPPLAPDTKKAARPWRSQIQPS